MKLARCWFPGVSIVVGAVAAACGDGGGAGLAAPDAAPAPDPADRIIEHEFPAVTLAPGEERFWDCQSVSLGNEEWIYVNAVEMTSGNGWHHSNWFFVPPTTYPGPDGTWDCRDRGFDTVAAGVEGGVLYAQSTQAVAETQQFGPGVTIPIPPRAVIVGDIHVLNASTEPLTTSITLRLHTLPEDEVTTWLSPMALEYLPLRIPPLQSSRFQSTCDFVEAYGAPADFAIHYVLPHYHTLGTGARLEALGGPAGDTVIFESTDAIGEPLGGRLDPPLDVTGTERFRFSCSYDNPTDQIVRWGLGDAEMCAILLFTDGPLKWAGGVLEGGADVSDEAGVEVHDGACDLFGFAPR